MSTQREAHRIAPAAAARATQGAPMAAARPLIGFGRIWHRRLRPVEHAFGYASYFLLLPMRALRDQADAGLRRNRFGALSFFDCDHGDGRSDALAWLDELLAGEQIDDAQGEVWLHTFPRVLGHVFNPVSFWYAHRTDGTLAAVVAEVNNTFGDRHAYVLPVEGGHEWRRKKLMHVSPFTQPDAGTYAFALPPPGPRVEATIDLTRAGSTVVATRLSLERRPLDDRAILSALVRYPFQTLKVIAAIHFEALRLWSKGARFWPRPPYDPAAARGGPV